MILAGDIGGTHARLALFRGAADSLTMAAPASYPTQGHPSLEAILRQFLVEHPGPVQAACLGIAGPVLHNRVVATNLAWVVDGASIASALGLADVLLINDLVALAHGALAAAPNELVSLQRGEEVEGNRALIAAGTGLGVAGLLWNDTRHLPVPTEGGHADFAPIDDLGMDLYRFLRAKFGHVSFERVLSGPGLQNVYEFLRDTGRAAEPVALAEELRAAEDVPAAISANGMAARYPICEQSLDIFCRYYGAAAGNVALNFVATGGLYVGGGIVIKVLPRLEQAGFVSAFNHKGRLSALLERTPVAILSNEHAALIGAAHAAVASLGANFPNRQNLCHA